jgi:hypothetical protein
MLGYMYDSGLGVAHLRGHVQREKAPLEDTLRRVIPEELRKAG